MSNIFAAIRSVFSKIVEWVKKILRREDFPGNEIVDYYGCPNSNRTRKLQLESKLWK